MKRKFKIKKDMVDRLDEYSYEEKVKYAAILKILQEDGLTDEMIQKWGRWYKGKHGLLITLSKNVTRVIFYLFNIRINRNLSSFYPFYSSIIDCIYHISIP